MTMLIEVVVLISSLVLLVVAYGVWLRGADKTLARKYAAQAIVAAFRMSELQADKVGARLDGEDKAAVVALAYRYLPPRVTAVIGEDEFVMLAGSVYDELIVLFNTAREGLVVQFAEWERGE